MRALVVQLAFLGCMPLPFVSPYVGVLLYYWFTLFNPHRLIWSPLVIEWGKVIVLVTLLGWMTSREPKKIPVGLLNGLLIVFFIWTVFTTATARYPSAAWTELFEWSKICLMALVATALITTRLRLHAFLWTASIGIGFFAVKGGIFTLVTAGNYHVLGPPGTFIANTNELARAFLMAIPLAYYLALHSKYKIIRVGFYGLAALNALALLGTTSRTAFLALGIMFALWWLRSPRKIIFGTAFAVLAATGYFLLPEERTTGLTEKYETIEDYEDDQSLQSRFAIWETVIRMANRSPIVGEGFGSIERATGRAPHSNYFEVLGEHGYVGLIIYLLMVIIGVVYSGALYRRTRSIPSLKWASDLAMLLQISYLSFLAAGVTKNHAFFEIYYMEFAMLVCLGRIVAQELPKPAEAASKGVPATPPLGQPAQSRAAARSAASGVYGRQ